LSDVTFFEFLFVVDLVPGFAVIFAAMASARFFLWRNWRRSRKCYSFKSSLCNFLSLISNLIGTGSFSLAFYLLLARFLEALITLVLLVAPASLLGLFIDLPTPL